MAGGRGYVERPGDAIYGRCTRASPRVTSPSPSLSLDTRQHISVPCPPPNPSARPPQTRQDNPPSILGQTHVLPSTRNTQAACHLLQHLTNLSLPDRLHTLHSTLVLPLLSLHCTPPSTDSHSPIPPVVRASSALTRDHTDPFSSLTS